MSKASDNKVTSKTIFRDPKPQKHVRFQIPFLNDERVALIQKANENIEPHTLYDSQLMLFHTPPNTTDTTIEIKKVVPHAYIPTRATPYSAGIDVYALEPGIIEPHSQKVVSLGIQVKPPNGHYLQIKPRSGLALKHSVNVKAGVIDPDY